MNNFGHILNSLDDNYFFRDNEFTKSTSSSFGRFKVSSLPTFIGMNKDEIIELNDVYKKYCFIKQQSGFSHSKGCHYLKIIKCLYFELGGHVILPSYLTKDNNTYSCEPDPLYKLDFERYNHHIEWGIKKRLQELMFLYVLPDGRIIEFIFDYHQLYQDDSDEKMFKAISLFLLKEELENTLIEKKNMKINKI